MKKSIKWLALVLAVCLMATPVLAASGAVQATLNYRDIKITVDGRDVTPVDINGESTEPFIIDGSTYVPVRALSEALGCGVEWDNETSTVIVTSTPILAVIPVGFVDSDGAKICAVAVEYRERIKGDSVSLEDFEVETYDTLENPKLEKGNDPGKALKAYVNDIPDVAETGKALGRYVIIEVNTDFMRSSVPGYAAAMSAGVRQVGEVTGVNGVIPAGKSFVRNYALKEVESVTPSGSVRVNRTYTLTGDYDIHGIEGYELHYTKADARYDAKYPAFLATNCFEEATGESIDVELPYALFVPADYDSSKKYALVLDLEDAGALGVDPMIALTEAQGPYNYASDEVQQLAKDQGLGGIIVVAPQISNALRTTRDNYTVSAAVPATWQLLDYLTEKYSIDTDRIYGTGQSMGGMQIMAMAAQRDNYFAGQWYLGMQWGNNYNKEEPYPERGGGSVAYYRSEDPTIYRTDADGKDSDLGQNVYYLISDDNILLTNCAGDAFSTGVWKELKFLYSDIAGAEIPYTEFNPLTTSVEEQNAALEALLAIDAGKINFHWQAFNGGSHMLTWVYGHKLDAGYVWLLNQTRTAEQERPKLAELDREWKAETDAAKLAAKQTEERAIGDSAYYAVPAEGAGTKGYNSAWFGMQGTLTDDVHGPGWTPSN